MYRWSRKPYQEIFTNGFQAPDQGNADNNIYHDLDGFVHSVGVPVDPNRAVPRAFISTTINNAWRPNPSTDVLPIGSQIQLYRYEIFAPGGIWSAVTLKGRYQNPNLAEITFVAGIAPQYICSVQMYTATRPRGDGFPTMTREIKLIMNSHFLPHMDLHFTIYTPLTYYKDDNGMRRELPKETYTPHESKVHKREVSSSQDNEEVGLHSYGAVEATPIYINAAFRASANNEAYLFMNNEYVLINYARGSTNDYIINGPLYICDGYPSLARTPFGEHGIDCAFDTDKTQAYIFSANLCALIDYAPRTTDDKIVSGPMTITDMFPFFKDTVFERGLDAAFRAHSSNEAYLFRGGHYALINYSSKKLIHIETIRHGFHSLIGTVFENGVEAAFASHATKEAYLFKGEYYANIYYAPGTTDDYLIGGRVKPILSNWPSLSSILPRDNGRLDLRSHKDHTDEDYGPVEL
ncbi:albumin-2 protein [Medicago truncatula]|uniref:Albumin-2 protein n=1 Tax=Medicago truncatula TaxID=3880 RepID=G7LEK7_MEDTR|nr:albumin-2 protein [Medicago truncatula]